MKIPIIIQARMSSSRLPGKVLMDFRGKPLLKYLFERLAHAGLLEQTALATSSRMEDEALFEFCCREGVSCIRGELNDVAARFIKFIEGSGCDSFVRICGDSPLFDPEIIVYGIKLFLKSSPDLLTNTSPRSFPRGQSLEIFDSRTFVSAYPRFTPEDREHISRYFYTHSSDFKIVNFHSGGDYSSGNFCIDDMEDALRFERLIDAMDRPQQEYSWSDLVKLQKLVSRRNARG